MKFSMKRWQDESGATLVVVAVSLFALFGITMLAVDGGSLFTTRRSLVTDTDASALAAARYLNNSPTDCLLASNPATETASASFGEAETVLQANDGRNDLVPDNFEVEPISGGDCSAGKVRVASTITSQVFFSGLFGFDGFEVFSSSSAVFGHYNEMKGLRPVGICRYDGHFAEWEAAVALDPDHPEEQVENVALDPLTHLDPKPAGALYPVHRVEFRDPALGGDCGGDDTAGNWGWMDYDGGGSGVEDPDCKGGGGGGSKDLACRIDHGYAGSVGTVDCDETEPGADDPCPAEAGAKNSAKDNLDNITCDEGQQTKQVLDGTDTSCSVIWILVYEEVTVKTSGGGKTLLYHPYAFLRVILRDWSDGVLLGNPAAEDYFDFEFVGWLEGPSSISGRLGRDTTGLGLLPKAVQLCGGNYGGTIDENCDF